MSLSRPDILVGVPEGVPDTTTVAAHDFTRTGFMPPRSPTSRLPPFWDQWEAISSDAISQSLQLGDKATSTSDEPEFYLVSGRIELAAVVRSTMDELFVGDDIAIRRITEYLHQLASVIRRIKLILLELRTKCSPDIFYHQIRHWLRGEDSQKDRKWIFEGIDEDPSLVEPVELSGPSAAQSSLLQALDIFLGVDQYSPLEKTSTEDSNQYTSFLKRMRLYMPRHHRAFLTHLERNPRPLRQ